METATYSDFVLPDGKVIKIEKRLPFLVQSANAWVKEASTRPNPTQLWSSLWFENEVACLFADSNTGKSVYAIQIAEHIARSGKKVLYFDFEMSDKQFQRRYTDDGSIYQFSDNFIRAELAPGMMGSCVKTYMLWMKKVIEETQCKIVIIDNISWICNRSENGDEAGDLMQQLIVLKRKMGLSILCLAHTPKRAPFAPLTQNSLAGSKKLANFFDSVFAIGIDRTNLPYGRYIKQIKVRSSELEYGETNVIRATIEKRDLFLGIWNDEENLFAKENDLLVDSGTSNTYSDERREQAIQLLKEGRSQRDVAAAVKMSLTTVSNIYKEHVKGA